MENGGECSHRKKCHLTLYRTEERGKDEVWKKGMGIDGVGSALYKKCAGRRQLLLLSIYCAIYVAAVVTGGGGGKKEWML